MMMNDDDYSHYPQNYHQMGLYTQLQSFHQPNNLANEYRPHQHNHQHQQQQQQQQQPTWTPYHSQYNSSPSPPQQPMSITTNINLPTIAPTSTSTPPVDNGFNIPSQLSTIRGTTRQKLPSPLPDQSFDLLSSSSSLSQHQSQRPESHQQQQQSSTQPRQTITPNITLHPSRHYDQTSASISSHSLLPLKSQQAKELAQFQQQQQILNRFYYNPTENRPPIPKRRINHLAPVLHQYHNKRDHNSSNRAIKALEATKTQGFNPAPMFIPLNSTTDSQCDDIEIDYDYDDDDDFVEPMNNNCAKNDNIIRGNSKNSQNRTSNGPDSEDLVCLDDPKWQTAPPPPPTFLYTLPPTFLALTPKRQIVTPSTTTIPSQQIKPKSLNPSPSSSSSLPTQYTIDPPISTQFSLLPQQKSHNQNQQHQTMMSMTDEDTPYNRLNPPSSSLHFTSRNNSRSTTLL